MRRAALVIPLLFATGANAAEIMDGPAAIEKAQHICRLTPLNMPGQWQAKFVKDNQFGDEWHVWFGKDQTEPLCGFYGAVVKADGSYTSCRASACKPASGLPKIPSQP